jgi:hypothetical protein
MTAHILWECRATVSRICEVNVTLQFARKSRKRQLVSLLQGLSSHVEA